jgi:membrane-associated phospholipid phosphatase
MIVMFLVAYAFFAFLQTYVDRPILTADDVLTRMIRDVYANDHPYNDFPSLHVAASTVIAIHGWRFSRYSWPLIAWAGLIALSTVMVKQHYVPDIAGGLALGFGTSLAFLRRLDRGGDAVPAPHASARAAA